METDDISLRHLRVLTLLLETGSLTRAAQILETTQPTLSKVLARLRAYFDDPLFVRVGPAMHPTPKAVALGRPLGELLASSAAIRSSAASFEPASSSREFAVVVTDVGMIAMLPQIIAHLERGGRGLRLKAVPFDARQLETRLEAGEADIALGAFPDAAPTMRRQRLYADPYVSVARTGHPRLAMLARADGFLRERHVVVTSSNAGHAAHRLLDRALKSELDAGRVLVRVPSFVTSAFVASSTDAVATLPRRLAECLCDKLGLAVFPTPLALPPIEICQLWHERVDHDPGHRWFRRAIRSVFGETKPGLAEEVGPGGRIPAPAAG